MRWSTRIMIPGVLLMALGLAPLAYRNFNDFALEWAASLVTIGLLIFLVGWFMRRARKAYDSAFVPPGSTAKKGKK